MLRSGLKFGGPQAWLLTAFHPRSCAWALPSAPCSSPGHLPASWPTPGRWHRWGLGGPPTPAAMTSALSHTQDCGPWGLMAGDPATHALSKAMGLLCCNGLRP